MHNPAIAALDLLVGQWSVTLTDAWFLESRDVRQQGRAVFRWLGDAFVQLEVELEGEPVWHFVFGRSDPDERLVALYHDPRPTARLFAMTFGGGEWTMSREDPDFFQRFVASVGTDRIAGRWEASEDAGTTWRKDFDLTFERIGSARGRPAPRPVRRPAGARPASSRGQPVDHARRRSSAASADGGRASVVSSTS